MALSKLSGDEQGIIFSQLCNALDPRVAVALSSVSNELREPTLELLQQLRAEHEAATVLCVKLGLWSCKKLREARRVDWYHKGLSAADLALLGTLGSVLPALLRLAIGQSHSTAGPDGVQRLAAGLGAGALPALTFLYLHGVHVGDTGASALAAALDRGALPQLEDLTLHSAAITDVGLVALAPALRRRSALTHLCFGDNFGIGDKGLVALLAPPLLAGALPPPTGVLTKLRVLGFSSTQVSDAGCATLAAAFDSGKLPVLDILTLYDITASAAAKATVNQAHNDKDRREEEANLAATGCRFTSLEESDSETEDEPGEEEESEEEGDEDDEGS